MSLIDNPTMPIGGIDPELEKLMVGAALTAIMRDQEFVTVNRDAFEKVTSEFSKRAEELSSELRRLEDWLFRVCEDAEDGDSIDIRDHLGLASWYKSQAEIREKRRRSVAERAKAKLTPEELDALGIKP